jgi:hypothetical protein
MSKTTKEDIGAEPAQGNSDEKKGFFDKYGAYLLIGCLIIYVILLAIGTIAEIFKIQSILDWWIWSPPGR